MVILTIFDHFQGRKNHFLDYFKVDLELFRSYLGIILGLKRPTFSCFLAQKVDIWPLKSKSYVKIWASERVILTIFRVKKPVFWTFWKLVWSSSEVVWASFLALKATLSTPHPLLWGPAEALPREKTGGFWFDRKSLLENKFQNPMVIRAKQNHFVKTSNHYQKTNRHNHFVDTLSQLHNHSVNSAKPLLKRTTHTKQHT